MIALACGLAASAQTGSGSWYLYSSFVNFDDIVETPSKVYYLSNGSLYSYDKSTDENYTYTTANVLHDGNIKSIEYNPLGKYLAVIYNNSNIDLIRESGEVTNLSDIKDAVLYVTPVINDIAFGNGRMAVATNFGVVLFDDKRGEVVESGMYNLDIKTVALNDKNIYIYYTKDGQTYWQFIELSRHINNLDKFHNIQPVAFDHMYAVGDNIYTFKNGNSTEVNVFTINPVNTSTGFSTTKIRQINNVIGKVNYLPDGQSYFYNNGFIRLFDKDANVGSLELPEQLKQKPLAFFDRETLVWSGTPEGLARYDFASGDVKLINDAFKPVALSTASVGRIYPMEDGGVTAMQRSVDGYYVTDWQDNYRQIYPNYVNGDIVIPFDNDVAQLPTLENVTSYLQYPGDKTIEFMGTERFGLYRLKNGVLDHTFTRDNSKVGGYGDWIRSCAEALSVDGKGNLYVISWNNSTTPDQYGRVVMLPADKVAADNLTADDWVQILRQDQLDGGNEGRNGSILAAKKSNLVLANHYLAARFAIINTRGTTTNADDDIEIYTSVVDQDNRTVTIDSRTVHFLEDNNGDIWVACDKGIFIISDPHKYSDAKVEFRRVKVPRNDGTNYADYLLDAINITGMAVDSANNKWFTTKGDGVYLVSEDGRTILQHFTSANSPLPTDDVYAVACDPKSNMVYFGTILGLVRYNSTIAPSAENLDDVYAYPNPVRPDYYGWIVVKNLMDNSVVKIADASGNVIFNGVSEGGMISWDGCDLSGQRVKTGVYYVFASKSGESQSAKAVTKILVVN